MKWKFISEIYFRLERDAKLGALEERADALQDGCAQFEKQAAAMKNKFWLENLKAMIAAGVAGVIVLGKKYFFLCNNRSDGRFFSLVGTISWYGPHVTHLE